MKNYIKYDSNSKEVIIQDLNVDRLLHRIDETYKAAITSTKMSNIRKLFNSIDYITWETTEMRFYSFFALEIYEMFNQLAEEYNEYKYSDIADELYHKTWISNYENKEKIKLDTLPLLQFNIKPKDFQLDFIKQYPSLKFAYELDGYILSFEQGLGKTFTSIALAECLKKEIVYIVCPNSVKENWADEIRQYYRKYNDNIDLWKREVYVSGATGYKATKDTKFIIVNQESIPNIFQLVQTNKDSMIIIDESHNFRGLYTKRVDAMLKLKELSNCHDCLLMSGTPIKATASELAPALRMIDPHFTSKLADIYYNTFTDSTTDASGIVKVRFKRCIYRKLKRDTLKLPDKFISDLRLKVPHEERFYVNKISKEITDQFHDSALNYA